MSCPVTQMEAVAPFQDCALHIAQVSRGLLSDGVVSRDEEEAVPSHDGSSVSKGAGGGSAFLPLSSVLPPADSSSPGEVACGGR